MEDMNFFISDNEAPIFLNKDVFETDYVADVSNYRNKQLKLMEARCRNLIRGKPPKNIILSGGYSTGKTTTLISFLEHLNLDYDNVETVYINCNNVKSRNHLLSKIYQKLSKKEVKQGINNKYLTEGIEKHLISNNSILIIGLDDMDSFKNYNDLNEFVGSVVKCHESDERIKIRLFIVSNKAVYCLSPDNKSNLRANSIHFDNYTYEQILAILKERCTIGFYPNVISEELIEQVAQVAYEENDLRHGINMLQDAGDLAEALGSHKILLEHFY